MGAVLTPAITIASHFPPIHPLKPGLPIERLKYGFIGLKKITFIKAGTARNRKVMLQYVGYISAVQASHNGG
jgi:hypothetical protein